MDFFDSDDDNGDVAVAVSDTTVVTVLQSAVSAVESTVFTEIMKLKPSLKRTNRGNRWRKYTSSSTIIEEQCESFYKIIGLVTFSSSSSSHSIISNSYLSLQKKLCVSIHDKSSISIVNINDCVGNKYDVLVCYDIVDNSSDTTDCRASCIDKAYICGLEFALVKGGVLILASRTVDISMFDSDRWIVKTINNNNACSSDHVYHIQSRCIRCNVSGAMSILGIQNSVKSRHTVDDNNDDPTIAAVDVEETRQHKYNSREEELLAKVTIPLSKLEIDRRIFSDATYRKAVECMKEYGLLILPGVFDRDYILSLGSHAIDDLNLAVDRLKKLKDIDLLDPQGKGMLDNYRELSMREALRCDLRNGPAMQKVEENNDIRNHAGIMEMLQVCLHV